MNNYKYCCIVLIIILFILFYFSIKLSSCDKNDNYWYLDKDEGINIKDSNNVVFAFWTGGFDSTFLILYNLIKLKKKVRPIYLVCSDVDSDNLLIQRKNKNVEIMIMKTIRKIFKKKYSQIGNNLLPTYYVTGVKIDTESSQKYQNIRKKYKHFESRKITQYERMSRFSVNFPYPIEIGLEKCGTGLDKATYDKRIKLNGNVILDPNLPKSLDDFKIFSKFRFPIAHLTKEDMIKIAKENEFYDLLEKSWSCWYPKINNKKIYPCNKCPMCKKRPI